MRAHLLRWIPLTAALLGCAGRPAPVVSAPMPGLRAAPADADDDPDPGRWPRGCEAAVDAALAAHPGPAAAAAALSAARADARVAITPAPELRIQAGLPRPEDGGRVGLRMPLPSPGEYRTRQALDAARVRIAEADLNVARVELAAVVRHLHLTARRARAAARRATEAAELADVTRDAISIQARVGVVPAVALADARLVRAEADAERRRAEAEATRAEAALRRLTGYGAADLPCAPPPDAVADEIPAVRAARARAEEAAAEVELDAARRQLALEWFEVAWDAVPEDPDRMLMGFTIRLPSIALAADPVGAHQRATEAERVAAERVARDAEADARVAWAVAVARHEALRADPALAEAEALQAKVQATRGKAPEVLGLRRRIIRARAALDEAAFEAEAAAIELRRARGIE